MRAFLHMDDSVGLIDLLSGVATSTKGNGYTTRYVTASRVPYIFPRGGLRLPTQQKKSNPTASHGDRQKKKKKKKHTVPGLF